MVKQAGDPKFLWSLKGTAGGAAVGAAVGGILGAIQGTLKAKQEGLDRREQLRHAAYEGLRSAAISSVVGGIMGNAENAPTAITQAFAGAVMSKAVDATASGMVKSIPPPKPKNSKNGKEKTASLCAPIGVWAVLDEIKKIAETQAG